MYVYEFKTLYLFSHTPRPRLLAGWHSEVDRRVQDDGTPALDRRVAFFDLFVTKKAARAAAAKAEHDADNPQRQARPASPSSLLAPCVFGAHA
jgi:hypothetical protein